MVKDEIGSALTFLASAAMQTTPGTTVPSSMHSAADVLRKLLVKLQQPPQPAAAGGGATTAAASASASASSTDSKPSPSANDADLLRLTTEVRLNECHL